MKGLQTYQIEVINEIEQGVLERLESWLDGYVKKYLENDDLENDDSGLDHFRDSTELAIEKARENAKYELEDFNSLYEIIGNSTKLGTHQLIDCDELDEPETYKFQMSIIRKFAKGL